MNYPVTASLLYRGKVKAVDSSVLQRDRNKRVTKGLRHGYRTGSEFIRKDPYVNVISLL